ncbi:hypothetical protein FVE85_9136 [Porphyridium purpureum]|uniref:DUF2252 domain-containing protein n=1 Tax=Porphyridium purpureum TaxID=35688 RepID=A0A5J4YQ98_PORPP|nr:hypothetical protein FVE85_9136 [Porphyridium purpureum]|eukprot:POR2169..scf222_8
MGSSGSGRDGYVRIEDGNAFEARGGLGDAGRVGDGRPVEGERRWRRVGMGVVVMMVVGAVLVVAMMGWMGSGENSAGIDTQKQSRGRWHQSGLDQDTEGEHSDLDSSTSVSGESSEDEISLASKAGPEVKIEQMLKESGACSNFTDDQLDEVPDCGSDLQRMRTSFEDENCGAVLASKRGLHAVVYKLRRLADEGIFVFFRGTAALFFNNLNCKAPAFFGKNKDSVPHVLSSGDAHPENFGTLMLANNNMTWGVNDFDHSFRSPFVVDVARGAAGFGMACKVMEGTTDCEKVIDAWTRGYTHQFRNGRCSRLTNADRLIEGSPALKKLQGGALVQSCFARARKVISSKKKILKFHEKFVDAKTGMFVHTKEVEPVKRNMLPAFEVALQEYLFNGVPAMAFFLKEKFFKLRDVAVKHGSGTGSLGLERYYMLIEGVTSEYDFDHVILEMKEVTNSVIERYEEETVPSLLEGKRAADGGRLAYPFANVFHGWVKFQNGSYLIRRKSYWRKSVKLDQISYSELVDYAHIAGVAQAHFHGLVGCASVRCGLNETASSDLDACEAVGEYLDGYPDFEQDMLAFAVREIETEQEQYDMFEKLMSKEPMKSNPLQFLSPKRVFAP